MFRSFLVFCFFLIAFIASGENLPVESGGKTDLNEFSQQIANYETIFDPSKPVVLPEGVTEEALVEAFCVSSQAIDQRLATITELQASSDPEAVRQRVETIENEVYTLYSQMLQWLGPVWHFAPKKPEVERFMFFLLASSLDGDQYEAAYVLARELMAQKAYEKNPVLFEMAGISAFMVSKFEVARHCFTQAQEKNALTSHSNIYLDLIPYYSQAWKTEQALRNQETLKGTIPRVLLTTTRGEVEIELFEASAPQTVQTFLKLVKEGFYDGDSFSTVLSGLLARTDRVAPGIEVPDEFTLPSARKHFRGSVVLMHGGGKDSGHSQFFIMLTPAPQLDGKFTVFGRVTRGIEVISALNRVDARHPEKNRQGITPDQILSIKILNP